MKYIIQVLSAIVLIGIPAAVAVEADDQYMDFSTLLQSADTLNQSGQLQEAHEKYAEAHAFLTKLSTRFPNWNTQLVAFRLNDIASKRTSLSTRLGANSNAVPTVVSLTDNPSNAPAAEAESKALAIKLWPLLTPGIYNHANALAMKCEVAEDGLTVSDAAWDTYQVAGCAKRWTLNMGTPMSVPLKHYKFRPEYSGLPVNITIEFYNPARPWEVKQDYQEIILLGGKARIGLPEWFHTPTNRLGYDFDEGDWFPSGWALPRGKYALWQGAAKARQTDRKGECPVYDFGFTHVSPIAMTHNGSKSSRERRANLFTDNEWVTGQGEEGANPKNWKIEPFYHNAETCAIITPDFEAPNYLLWKDAQYDAFAKLISDVRARRPDVLIGCWGVGVVGTSFRIFDARIDGQPTGVTDLTGAKQWRDKYNNPAADLHKVFQRCNLNYANPAHYWVNNPQPPNLPIQ